jgi:hypothetical protein
MSSSIYDKNRMLYDYAQSESVKVVPTDLQQIPFDDQSYEEGQTMTITFSTGDYFLDPEKSYIQVGVGIVGNGVNPLSVNFGRGSCANLFGGCRIYHKSGTQITHNVNLDLWTKAKQKIEKDGFWFNSKGLIQGYLADPTGAGQSWWVSTSTQPEVRTFKIKLADLHPFFRGTDRKIFPPQIADGLRIELDLNTSGRVFFINPIVAPSSPIVSWNVSSCSLQAALVDVQDQAADITNDVAISRGLQWEFNDVFITTITVNENESDINIPVEKAVRKAQNVITFFRNRTGDTLPNFDSHVYPPQPDAQWNYRIGNILYPYKRAVNNPIDSYTVCIDNFEWQYGTNLTFNDFDAYDSLYTTLLRTEDQLLASGDFLNANKRVELQFQKSPTQESLLGHSCLEYRRVLTVNGVNSKVED